MGADFDLGAVVGFDHGILSFAGMLVETVLIKNPLGKLRNKISVTSMATEN
jgi:hypothetical protein